MSGRRMTQRAVRATGWVFITALALAPVLVLALGALSSAWFFPDPWPADLTLRHAVDTLQAPATRDAIGAGLTISAIVTVLAVALSWPAAQVLARPHLTGRAVVAAVLLLPSLLPPVGLAIGLDVFLLRAGLAGTPTGVVVAHLVPVLPYVVVSLAAGFARHDRLLEAQAAVLGAAGRQRLLHVTIPAMRRSIIVAAALGFVVSWSQYLLTVLVGSGKVITITTLLFAALAGGNPTTVGVLALVVALPAVGVLVFAGTRTEPASRS